MIDLLPYIPKKTSSDCEVFVKEKGEFLELSFKHPRSKPFKLRRFVDPKILGSMFGQYQAEGTKDAKKKFRLEFTNKLIQEHKEFSDGLFHLGVTKEKMIFEMIYQPDFSVDKMKNAFEKHVGKITVFRKTNMKGKYGFRTYVRNTLLLEIFLNALDSERKKMTKENTILSDCFFAKMLTGDGTVDTRTNNREYDYPHTRINITDRNFGYLKDYSDIMKNLGFTPHIIEKYICVRSGCTVWNLLYLYKIRAFENSRNWNKLLVTIGLYLEGRRHNTYYRFIELEKLGEFTSKDYMNFFGFSLRVTNDWLNNKEKEGLLIGKRNRPYPVKWSLTPKAIKLVDTLKQFKKELDSLTNKREANGLLDLLNSLKTKSSKT
jgi:hypothetical protein